METLGTETSTKQQTNGGEESDFSMPFLEEEREDGVGGATERDEEMKEEHDEVGVATEEHDVDLYNEEQGDNTDEEEGMAKTCPDELGAGLRRRNRHD